MLLIDGKLFEFKPLPMIYFGHKKPLAYVLNPKVASTLTLNFLFYLNRGYRYFDPTQIHHSSVALFSLNGTDLHPQMVRWFMELAPERFSIVRDPLKRFVSAFVQKVFLHADPVYHTFCDELTSLHGIDLSPEADPRQSCVAFAKWMAAQEDQEKIDLHFRPQHFNLAMGGRFTVDTILRIEDQDALTAYFSRWVSEEEAKWFLGLRLNEQKRRKAEEFMSDELEALVRQIYARDYELFYS